MAAQETANGVRTDPTDVVTVKLCAPFVLSSATGLCCAPWRPVARQRPALEHATESTEDTVLGSAAVCQLVPPSLVEVTTAPPVVLRPAATQ